MSPDCKPSAGMSSVNTIQSCSRIMSHLQGISCDESRRLVALVHLPDCAQGVFYLAPSNRLQLRSVPKPVCFILDYFISCSMLFKRNGQDFPGIQTEAKSREKPRSARVKAMLGIEQILPNPRLVHDRYMRIWKLHVPLYRPTFHMGPG